MRRDRMLGWGLSLWLMGCAAPPPAPQSPEPVVVEVAAPPQSAPAPAMQEVVASAEDEADEGGADEERNKVDAPEDGDAQPDEARKRSVADLRKAGILGVLQGLSGGGIISGSGSGVSGVLSGAVSGGSLGGGTVRSAMPSTRGGNSSYRLAVRRVVRRHLVQVRHCYQRELQKKPGLAGRLKVDFVIGTTGGVVSAVPRASTLGSRAVETCVTTRFVAMRFPKPKKGIVKVSYPLVFETANPKRSRAAKAKPLKP